VSKPARPQAVEIDPLGSRTTYTYDGAGWQIAQVDHRGNPVYFALDEVGNQGAEIDAVGQTTDLSRSGSPACTRSTARNR
jgi:YD repeat-containing protein